MKRRKKIYSDFSFMEMTPKITFIGNCKHDIKENFVMYQHTKKTPDSKKEILTKKF